MVWDHQRGRRAGLAAGLARDGAQRLFMQVIEMRVGDQHDVGRRQIAQIQSWLTQALQDEKPAREVGIDDNVVASNLEEKAGVPDERDAQFAV